MAAALLPPVPVTTKLPSTDSGSGVSQYWINWFQLIRRNVNTNTQNIATNTSDIATNTQNIAALTLAEPLIVNLPDTTFAALNTWYPVLPATTLTLPRSTKSLVAVMVNPHLIWTAASASQGLCDWSVDGQVHYIRTYHAIVNKADDSSVNDASLTFPMVVTGTNTVTVSIAGRQIAGALGITVIGGTNTTWPALQSKAAIIDLGQTL